MTTYFTEDHEWIAVEGSTGTVGITNHAQEQLGDITFVELPETGSDRTLDWNAEEAIIGTDPRQETAN